MSAIVVVPVFVGEDRDAALRREFPGGPPPDAELVYVEGSLPGDWSTLTDEERDAALVKLIEEGAA